jgi:DNA-binding transcriptional regulator GbsR (MarR family)
MQFTRNELYTITDALIEKKVSIEIDLEKGTYYDAEKGRQEVEDIKKLLEKIKEMI